MMTSTHGLIGLCLGYLAVVFGLPNAEHLLIGSFVGGLFPDLDLLREHRKSLHFPVYYTITAIALLVIYMIFSGSMILLPLFFLASASIHTFLDVISGGLAPKKFKETKPFPVYSHYHDKWISKKLIRYDGSPEDLIASLITGAIAIYFIDGFRYLAVFLLSVSAVYFTFRMKIHRFSLKLID